MFFLQDASQIIKDFKLSPEDQSKADQLVRQLQSHESDEQRNYDVSLNTIASQNIKGDSEDKYSERARPSFIYLVNFVIAVNYILLPVLKGFKTGQFESLALPTDLLTLFGVCVTGYVVSRSAEKISALPGESSINLGGLLKVGNKS